MTFNEKLGRTIENFENIEKPDHRKYELTLYADFVEIVCLFSNEEGTTEGEIQDRFYGQKDYRTAESRDKDENFITKIFSLIQERIYLFGADYPFSWTDDESLQLKMNLSISQKLYIYLLIASNLDIFNDFQKELTADFELVSYQVLKNFLPKKAIVKSFGKKTDYTGNAKTKIRKLAKDLKLRVNEDNLDEVPIENIQERGADNVAWMPFEDDCHNFIIFLAQSACGKKYEYKQHETRRFANYLHFYRTKPQHVLFITYSLVRKNSYKFIHSDLFEEDFLIFERKRVIEYYGNNHFENLDSSRIVNETLKYKKRIV